MLPRKPLFELLSGSLTTSPEDVPVLWFQEALLSLWSRAHMYQRDTVHCNYRGKVTCVPGVCVTLQIPPTLPQIMSSVNSKPKTQTVPAEIRVHNLTYSDSEHIHLINTELFWGYFQGQTLCAATGTNTGKRYKVYALRIILLDPPGNISPNKILLNTSRIKKLPATLQKMFSAVGYWFQTGGKGFTAAKRRLKRCSYLYHPGQNADLGEFVLLRVMVTLSWFKSARLLSDPNRDTLSGQRVSSPSRLLKVAAANVFPIT